MGFSACEICGAESWEEAHAGDIRDGAFGTVVSGAGVARCGGCGAERLDERFCLPESDYESDAYRRRLAQGVDAASYHAEHDANQIFTQQAIWPRSARGAVVADIGCAGGSLLDGLRGVALRALAIEPCTLYHDSLGARGYAVYPTTAAAAEVEAGRVDLAFSIQVIEHVANPRAFLEEIRRLLKPDGRLVISTPNRNDILLKLLPDQYPAFFYRRAHRWYFDAASLGRCAEIAGLGVAEARHVQRYGLSNAMRWLRDRRPGGRRPLDGLDVAAETFWKGYLEQTGQSDCLYLELVAPC